MSLFVQKRRKELGYTQQSLAEKLNVSFQAVSKWENGVGYPNTEILIKLSKILEVSVDELLNGIEEEKFTYKKSGVDVSYTDSIKNDIKEYLVTNDKRVLNGLGPFASLYDIKFDNIKDPVLVLKSEEPGSKQLLATKYGYMESVCHDMINHLVNDIVVMGAKPLAVLDTIVCGSVESETIKTIIKGISESCKENECSLVGGETSIQPKVIEKGTYILTSSIAGIIDKSNIIDGSKIKEGDVIIAISSNGIHTNGYTLVRMLLEKMPQIENEIIDGKTFIENIMKPHEAYYKSLKELLNKNLINGMAHITGGGIEGNICRIVPDNLSAEIDLSKIKVLPIFKFIKKIGDISDNEMLSTFNCGVGITLVTSEYNSKTIINHISQYNECYIIGKVTKNKKKVSFINNLKWD